MPHLLPRLIKQSGRSHWLVLSGVAVFVVLLIGQMTESKTPAWQSTEHPRLITTPSERTALLAKLNAPGTASNAIWTAFQNNNFSATTNSVSYADGAVLYWLTGNEPAGRKAIENGLDLISKYTTNGQNGIEGQGIAWPWDWWRYRDLLLTYDFTQPILTAQEKQTFLDFMILQGTKCQGHGPAWTPGNIDSMVAFCLYGTAMVLEGESNLTRNVTNEAHAHVTNGAVPVAYHADRSNLVVSLSPGGPNAFTEGVDFTIRYVPACDWRCLDWSLAGNEPANGQTYYISYTVTPNLPNWKSHARTAFEFHLNYNWRDGNYTAGPTPYTNFMTDMLPYWFEMIKRDTGVDYGLNRDVKRVADMFLYERLPGTPRRFNALNDSTMTDAVFYPYPDFPLHSWFRTFVAWGMTKYANDPEGYGQKFHFLWTQTYRNPNGMVAYTPKPDWREAWWINDGLVGTYPNTSVPDPSWPKHRYFRGKEIVYTRTGPWTGDDSLSTVASFVAGPHSYYNEHDQGDSGSFTFFSLGEDWAIDSGYGHLDLDDHSTVGIDNAGFPDTYGAFAHFDSVVLTDDASAVDANLDDAWSINNQVVTTPQVDFDHRYAAVINGTQPSYLVIADDIQKNTSSHSYQWYLQTGFNNAIALNGLQTTITGTRTNATMKVHTLNPTNATTSQASQNGHPRLKVQATSTASPRFLHLLIPTSLGQTPPVVTRQDIANGTLGQVAWPDGTTDTILWRHGTGQVTASGITSDAKLAIVRVANNQLTGLVAINGRSVIRNGTEILSVLDGVAPVTVTAFGATAGLRGTDASRVRLGLPFVTNLTLEDGGVTVPVLNDGQTVFVNTGLPLGQMRAGELRYQEPFTTASPEFMRYNLDRCPAEQCSAVGGVQELQQTNWDWPSTSRRDSTPYHRANVYPTMMPPFIHDNATVNFRFRFADTASATRKFEAYLRTTDRNSSDWNTNQDYFRLEFNAAANTITLGQRVNGAWASIDDNAVLTNPVTTVNHTLNNTSWHPVVVRMLGNAVTVTVDGQTIITTTLPVTIPTAPSSGYLQWRSLGTTPVQLDDIEVRAIDLTPPVAPTSGDLAVSQSGQVSLSLNYGQGQSTDTQSLVFFQSASLIQPTTDPTTLTTLATSQNLTTMAFTGANQTLFHAVGVRDASGNTSLLLPLQADLIPPAAITDLMAQ